MCTSKVNLEKIWIILQPYKCEQNNCKSLYLSEIVYFNQRIWSNTFNPHNHRPCKLALNALWLRFLDDKHICWVNYSLYLITTLCDPYWNIYEILLHKTNIQTNMTSLKLNTSMHLGCIHRTLNIYLNKTKINDTMRSNESKQIILSNALTLLNWMTITWWGELVQKTLIEIGIGANKVIKFDK